MFRKEDLKFILGKRFTAFLLLSYQTT